MPMIELTPELMAALSQLLAQQQAKPKPLFRDLWVKYEAFGSARTDGGRTRIPSWNDNQRFHARRLLPFFGDLAWDTITLAKAEEYRQWRLNQPVAGTTRPQKATTRNRELRSAQGCLSHAVRMGLIPHSCLMKMQDENEVHERSFSIDDTQFLKIVRNARPLLRFFLLILNETGMRRGELLKLEWHEVDIDGGYVHLPAQKTKAKKAREVPLSTTARMILEMIPRDGVNTYVFANQHKPTGHIGETTLGDWFRDARDAAGVTGPKGQPIWLHTLRHKFATDMATSGLDIETLMNICGWADERIARVYMNIARRHRENAKGAIDARGATVRATLTANGAAGPRRAPLGPVVPASEPEPAYRPKRAPSPEPSELPEADAVG